MNLHEKYWIEHFAARHAPGAWEALRAGYEEPHRGYHSWRHIDVLIAELERHRALAERFDLILAAIFWHDVVYTTRASDGAPRPDADNVRDSAAMFRRYSAMSEADTAAVAALIMATADHVAARGNGDLDLFLDLDLSPLALPWDEFTRNTADIHKEFAWIPEREFLMGHGAILERFLSAKHLYRRPETRAAWEARARENIGRWVPELRRRAMSAV